MVVSPNAKSGREGGEKKPNLLFGFDRDLCLRVAKLVHELGGTDDQLAEVFGVDAKTFQRWKFIDLDILVGALDGASARTHKEEDKNKGIDRNLWLRVATLVCEQGGGDLELGRIFGVRTKVIRRWKAQDADFRAACQAGEGAAKARVERALYQLATGYTETKQEILTSRGGPVLVKRKVHHPPTPQACRFWLLVWQAKKEDARAAQKDPDRTIPDHFVAQLLGTCRPLHGRKP